MCQTGWRVFLCLAYRRIRNTVIRLTASFFLSDRSQYGRRCAGPSRASASATDVPRTISSGSEIAKRAPATPIPPSASASRSASRRPRTHGQRCAPPLASSVTAGAYRAWTVARASRNGRLAVVVTKSSAELPDELRPRAVQSGTQLASSEPPQIVTFPRGHGR